MTLDCLFLYELLPWTLLLFSARLGKYDFKALYDEIKRTNNISA